ncbi:MAG TPA: DUF3859 domain-containing protein [Gammaproteobacteria bacterium]|nr:DUF3859 domain-containing protein [Gammaproteobacteria bacterium]
MSTLVVLLAASPTAMGTNDMRPLTVLVLSEICAAQDPGFRDGLYGEAVSPSWPAFDKQPFHECLRRRQWVPASICTTVNGVDVDSGIDLDRWFYGHASDLEALEPVFDFANDAYGDPASGAACPDFKVDLPKDDRSATPGSWPDLSLRGVEELSAGEYEELPPPGMPLRTTRESDEVAGVVGVHFGLSFRIDAGDVQGLVLVRYRITVPPPGISDSTGSEPLTSVEYTADCALGRPCVVGFQFESDEEIVAGPWTFEVFYRDFKLLEHTFNVSPSDRASKPGSGRSAAARPADRPSADRAAQG